MNAQTLNWSDIPFVLAVCETGTLSGAARTLGVNHSTVFRRIESVESNLGVRLFERLSHGYVMTPAGEHFYRNGLQLRGGMDSLRRELGGQDLRLEGILTVTTTDSLLYCLTPIFLAFQNQYPDVELRILSESRPLNLTQRDADIALRPPLAAHLNTGLAVSCCRSFVQPTHKKTTGTPTSICRWKITAGSDCMTA